VRPFGRRPKKLIVAFQFQFANQAAWKCDECRNKGLERQRRCGWIEWPPEGQSRPVWVRRNVMVTSCPRSYISAESLSYVEAFFVWKAGGPQSLFDLPARLAEAFLILEREWRGELNGAEE
jgi:hypothetical protein